MAEKQSTGIPYLDRYLDGGIPRGSIVTILTDPMAEGELILRNFTFHRSVLYATTVRTPEAVRDWLREDAPAQGSGPTDLRADSDDDSPSSVTIIDADLDDPLTEIGDAVAKLPDRSTIVVDSMNRLESEDEDEFIRFLKRLAHAVRDSSHTCVLHVLENTSITSMDDIEKKNRIHTHEVSDSVWKVSSEMVENRVNHYLAIEKNRFGKTLPEPLRIEFDGGVTVDTSRTIS